MCIAAEVMQVVVEERMYMSRPAAILITLGVCDARAAMTSSSTSFLNASHLLSIGTNWY